MSGAAVRRFSYRDVGFRICFLLLLAATGALLMYLLIWYRRPDLLEAALFVGASFFVLLALFVVILFVSADIETDADSIRWVIFGRCWKELKWAKIDHIRTAKFWAWGTYSSKKIYYIYPVRRHRLAFFRDGGMFFNQNIHGFSELASIVISQAERHGIPIDGRNIDP